MPTPTGTATGNADGHRNQQGEGFRKQHANGQSDRHGHVQRQVRLSAGACRRYDAGAHRHRPLPRRAPPPTPAAKPKDPSDPAWITPDVEAAYTALDCNNPKDVEAIVDDPAKPMVTCSDDGQAKYILGPAEVLGSEVTNATSGQRQTQGGSTGRFEVRLDFNGAGATAFCNQTSRIVSLPAPRNQFRHRAGQPGDLGSGPQTALCAGNASITGNFTAASAKVLADQIKFGALPMSFTLQTQ